MLDDDIDYDKFVRHEIFCEFADEMLEKEIYSKHFPLADKTLKWMLLDKVIWLSDEFIDSFQNKYSGVSVSKLDEVSLLMKEAVSYHDEESIYDIFNTAVVADFGSFRSKIYLLDKAIFYCQGYFYPYKIYSYVEKEVRYSIDYHLLADSLAAIFEKHNVINPDAIKTLLDSSREKMHSDYEKLSLAFSYQRNGYHKEAEEIFKSTIDFIIGKIKAGEKDYQAVRSLIIALGEDYDMEEDNSCSWYLELTNRLYGAFYKLRGQELNPK